MVAPVGELGVPETVDVDVALWVHLHYAVRPTTAALQGGDGRHEPGGQNRQADGPHPGRGPPGPAGEALDRGHSTHAEREGHRPVPQGCFQPHEGEAKHTGRSPGC